jgi:diguanylate cyclase (GGDEF)-like protein
MVYLIKLEKRSQPLKIFLGFSLIGIVGVFDFLTGYELAFSLFYLFPIALITWVSGRQPGIIASFISSLVWLAADAASGNTYSSPLIPLWNTLIRFSFFVIITLLLSALKAALGHEKELARVDSLTGAVNSRFFYELAQMEIDRLQRYKHPFTLAYIDLDNFKTLNDQFGHPEGDRVLQAVVQYAKKHMRKNDVTARIGGDEFALLFPETGPKDARVALSKLNKGLLKEMNRNKWPISFCMGVVTCVIPPPTTNDLVKMADDLMYSVKRDSKNGIRYAVYKG